MADTETTCLDYLAENRISGREEHQIDQYYREMGVPEKMIQNAKKAMDALNGIPLETERMDVTDARKMMQIMNDCCRGFVFTKSELSQIAKICLAAIERTEREENKHETN